LDLSIVIVSWNTRDLLARCLASLPGAAGSLQTEVLVADNASADGTPAMVRERYPEVTLLPTGANLGFTRANNLALPRTTGDRILLLNPDTVCPAGALEALCAALDALPGAAAVGPDLRDEQGRPAASWGDFPRPWHHWLGLVDPARRWLPHPWRDAGLGRTADSASRFGGDGCIAVDYVKGACLLLRRTALERVGLLDERFFMYFEETDWCRRARDAGLTIHLCPDVHVTHLEGQATGLVSEFSLRQFHHSYRLYLAKHHGPAAVHRWRRALRAEYAWKARLRGLGSSARDRALARQYRLVADLQTRDDIAPEPPAGASAR
jgi:GT2 family glycosyltransferase